MGISSPKTNRKRRRAYRTIILEAKDRPCADCGIEWPHFVMDFDHCRGRKEFNIADGSCKPLAKLLSEIKKCDVVCAICHRFRTHKRQQTREN